ncbi:cyclic AMP-responsive element-binding protein 5-like isoform X2 [Denticeps clupeoides]|nr:cyclic AMP-responsive element-binding protein 5-like isoform X2 [Denticeps clupeoides]XP_028847509.1 cyclic AMP-responsive element-binding protein 5-like isoform X2 [Denticeps clupeoides]
MSLDDRPYICTAPGCSQCFQTKEHLRIHRHKHEMSLRFPSTRTENTLSDQTPTPTNFLQKCEEVGLFSELQLSPDDQRSDPISDQGNRTVGQGGQMRMRMMPLSPPAPHPNTYQQSCRFQSQENPTFSTIDHHPAPSQMCPAKLGASRRRHTAGSEKDERRQRFLERNRAAASRCRQKRKMWVSSLERKAEELTDNNVHLQNEVTSLSSEVTQLKLILQSHKDCPVTTRLRETRGHLQPQPTYTTSTAASNTHSYTHR